MVCFFETIRHAALIVAFNTARPEIIATNMILQSLLHVAVQGGLFAWAAERFNIARLYAALQSCPCFEYHNRISPRDYTEIWLSTKMPIINAVYLCNLLLFLHPGPQTSVLFYDLTSKIIYPNAARSHALVTFFPVVALASEVISSRVAVAMGRSRKSTWRELDVRILLPATVVMAGFTSNTLLLQAASM
jgi:hypothetical protein